VRRSVPTNGAPLFSPSNTPPYNFKDCFARISIHEKIMNPVTELDSELLSADARGKKHVPVAVFAVILIHVLLFVVLLIAAGCRSSARARAKLKPEKTPAQEMEHPSNRYLQAAATNSVPNQPVSTLPIFNPPVIASEPVVVEEPPAVQRAAAPNPRPVTQSEAGEQKPVARRVTSTKVERNSGANSRGIYVVQAGDTVGEIARNHGTTAQAIKAANKLKNFVIQPGQKLRLQPAQGRSSSTAQVKSTKTKTSNEV
jgi:LysM repeat protein